MQDQSNLADKSKQAAQGSYIAQADHGSTATVTVIQEASLKALVATAPSPPVNFVGRNSTLLTIKNLLTEGESAAVIALQGMGGIGKTATAQKIAAETASTFSGGVFWASLPDSNGDPLPILRAWALACAYDLPTDLKPSAMVDLVRGLLTQRKSDLGPILIIVDDVRQNWVEAAKLLRTALPNNAPFLTTTRDENLASILGATIHRLHTLQPEELMALLKVLIGPNLNLEDTEELASLLTSLGHLPLAIEIAGKRLFQLLQKPGFTINAFRKEVEARAGQVLTLPGQPGLSATFEITYSSLSSETQQLFRWLGAFASGPLWLTDISGVLSSNETLNIAERDVEVLLDSLVQIALLAWGRNSGSYTVHPLVRRYAQQLLITHDEERSSYNAHLNYFSEFIRTQSEGKMDFAEIDVRLSNFLLAAKRAFELRRWSQLIAFSDHLARVDGYLYKRGYWDNAIDLLALARDASENAGDNLEAIEITYNMAMIKRERGMYKDAEVLFEQAIRESTDLSAFYQLSNALSGLGYVHLYQANYADAETCFQKAIPLAKSAANSSALAEGLVGLARVSIATGRRSSVLDLLNESLHVFETAADTTGLMWALRVLGNYFELEHDYDTALVHLERGMELAKSSGHLQAEAYMERAIADVLIEQGNRLAALERLNRSQELCRLTGEQAGLAATLCRIGDVSVLTQDWETAGDSYRRSLQISESMNLVRWHGRSLHGLAQLCLLSPSMLNRQEARALGLEALSKLQGAGHIENVRVRSWLEENRLI